MSSGTDYLGNNTLVTVASGHLVSHPYLALLGDIHLGKPYNACRQLISNGYIVPLSLIYTVYLLEFNDVVMKKLFDAVVLFLVRRPLVGIDIQKINLLKLLKREFGSFWDNINIQIIFHSL